MQHLGDGLICDIQCGVEAPKARRRLAFWTNPTLARGGHGWRSAMMIGSWQEIPGGELLRKLDEILDGFLEERLAFVGCGHGGIPHGAVRGIGACPAIHSYGAGRKKIDPVILRFLLVVVDHLIDGTIHFHGVRIQMQGQGCFSFTGMGGSTREGRVTPRVLKARVRIT